MSNKEIVDPDINDYDHLIWDNAAKYSYEYWLPICDEKWEYTQIGMMDGESLFATRVNETMKKKIKRWQIVIPFQFMRSSLHEAKMPSTMPLKVFALIVKYT